MAKVARAHESDQVEAASPSQPSIFPRLISASIGSIVTALAVTPLDVVKVRQQAYFPVPTRILPQNVSPCPRGCGTFVLNNGLMDCVVPKSAVPYFDSLGRLAGPHNSPEASIKSAVSTPSRDLGTFAMVRRIFLREGLSGIYAGLAPTLVMSVPNTVLYFTAYDEISSRLRSVNTNNAPYNFTSTLIPLISGSSARVMASVATAPLELIRTRQASRKGSGQATSPGLYTEFRTLIRADGFRSLYQGLAPTLWRDVPFSAIYWLCLERFKIEWQQWSNTEQETPLEAFTRAFVSGAVAGMIAAAYTTPFDVVKTRLQIVTGTVENVVQHQPQPSGVVCHHDGAPVYNPSQKLGIKRNGPKPSTFTLMNNIVRAEGISGLWRGNQTRMLKVAPACAIMISCYELGKSLIE